MAKNDEKIKNLLELVEQGTKNVFESDTYKNYLLTMSKFHNYSFRNSLLILLQRPDATRVAGYAAWQQKFKRQVQRGEKGIQIISYTPHNKEVEQQKIDSEGKLIYDANGKPIMETVTKQVPGFAPVYVYDVSQTKGEPLPVLATELDGSIDNYEVLKQAITDSSPLPVFFEQIEGSAKGYCTPEKIAIKEGMSNIQTIKTMVHEITHGDLHMPEKDLSAKDKTDQRTREVEAESTAFVVCSHYGIDTSDYSFPYLAGWSSSKELNELQNSLERIQKQAGELINRIDSRIEQLQHDRNLQHNKLQAQAAPTKLAEKIVNYIEDVDFTQIPYHEQRVTEFTGMLLSDKPQPIIETLKERAFNFPQEKDNVNNLISEIKAYAPEEKIELFQEKDVNWYLNGIQAALPVEQSPFARSGSTIKIDEETGELVSSKRNMKDPSQWTDKEVALFTIETDIQLFGSVQDETLKAIKDAGFSYTNGHLVELSDEDRRENEILDSIKFDNDIDLDKEKSRKQLGFKDETQKERLCMKDRIAAAQAEANKRNNAAEKKEPLQTKEERGI